MRVAIQLPSLIQKETKGENDMKKKVVKITVNKIGGYQLEALEGFAGASCTEQTKDLEILLGGVEEDSGKNDGYYKPDDSPITIDNLF